MTLFFFNDTAPTEIYTLSLHDALPISFCSAEWITCSAEAVGIKYHMHRSLGESPTAPFRESDRKSTRLNSSHSQISYAVFCLKKRLAGTSASPYSAGSSI